MSSKLHEVPQYVKFKVGDAVKVKPRVGSRFKGLVLRILADDDDVVREVEILEVRGSGTKETRRQIRTVVPDCVTLA